MQPLGVSFLGAQLGSVRLKGCIYMYILDCQHHFKLSCGVAHRGGGSSR